MEDDAMDFNGAEDEEMCSPVPNLGGSASARVAGRGRGNLACFDFMDNRGIGALTEGEQPGGEIDGEGEGEMRYEICRRIGWRRGWDERLNANAGSSDNNINTGRCDGVDFFEAACCCVCIDFGHGLGAIRLVSGLAGLGGGDIYRILGTSFFSYLSFFWMMCNNLRLGWR